MNGTFDLLNTYDQMAAIMAQLILFLEGDLLSSGVGSGGGLEGCINLYNWSVLGNPVP